MLVVEFLQCSEVVNSHLVERVRLDLRELVFHVVRVHGTDLIACGCAEHFDDFHELVDTGLAREKWLTEHQLSHDATSRPHIYCLLADCFFAHSYDCNVPIFVV
jgi:hypothetical protein